MNKVVEAALDIAGGTEIVKQVKDLQGNVMDTIGLKAETKEALQEANLDQVATTYEALATKVGITDQKELITKFIAKGGDKDKFIELHTKIKSLAQQGGADVSKLDEVLTTHELIGGSTMGFTIANALGKVWGFARKAMEKLNLIHSPKDLGKIVFAINEITAKIDVSKLSDNKPEEAKEIITSKEVVSPMKDGIVTSDMDDERKHGDHNAWDIVPSNPDEKAVVAAASGKVIKIGKSDEEGNFVIIEHNIDGIKYTTSYVHFDTEPNLEEGQPIEAGQYIADMGGLGAHSTGPHLHFKVKKNGEIIDPGEFLDPTQFKFKEHGKIVAFNQSEHAEDYPQAA